jgi:divalent metal cation (Fe/Co/Zn/Cd) transporter
LLGDFVTLFCWRLSRKPPSEKYPYGFAKFETLGTTTISLLLIGGALGIGFHSYHLLIVALGETATHLQPGTLHDVLAYISSSAPVPPIGHAHVHAVDVNAAWFAAGGVLTKEWLYRITKTVADEEKSPVLLANAIHHRSDAYSSLVAFFAILGTWLFPAFPLDPIGGKCIRFRAAFAHANEVSL